MNMINGLSVRTFGKPENQPILFLHGFPLDSTMWDRQFPDLAGDFYCVAPDFRGLGESVISHGSDTMESFVDDMVDVVKYLRLKNPVLCGLSMGGYVALRMAERNDIPLKALILCDTRANADTDEIKLKRTTAIKRIKSEGAEDYIREFVQGIFYESFVDDLGPQFNDLVRNWVKNQPEGVIGALQAMLTRTDTTGFLKQCTLPVLYICGAFDPVTPPAVMKEMMRITPGSEYFEVKEASHMAPLENYQDFNKKVIDFLSRI